MDCSPPGPSVHGIFQARGLEWVAIAFSDYSLQSNSVLLFRGLAYSLCWGMRVEVERTGAEQPSGEINSGNEDH